MQGHGSKNAGGRCPKSLYILNKHVQRVNGDEDEDEDEDDDDDDCYDHFDHYQYMYSMMIITIIMTMIMINPEIVGHIFRQTRSQLAGAVQQGLCTGGYSFILVWTESRDISCDTTLVDALHPHEQCV